MTTTCDQAPNEVRATPIAHRRIPERLLLALIVYIAAALIYAVCAITQAALHAPVPGRIHGAVMLALALGAVGWLAWLIIAKVGEHIDREAALTVERLSDQLAMNAAMLKTLDEDFGGVVNAALRRGMVMGAEGVEGRQPLRLISPDS